MPLFIKKQVSMPLLIELILLSDKKSLIDEHVRISVEYFCHMYIWVWEGGRQISEERNLDGPTDVLSSLSTIYSIFYLYFCLPIYKP